MPHTGTYPIKHPSNQENYGIPPLETEPYPVEEFFRADILTALFPFWSKNIANDNTTAEKNTPQ